MLNSGRALPDLTGNARAHSVSVFERVTRWAETVWPRNAEFGVFGGWVSGPLMVKSVEIGKFGRFGAEVERIAESLKH